MKIYALVSGEYSDYSVHTTFSTKELAEQAAIGAKVVEIYDSFRVEEYDVWDTVPSPYLVHVIEKDGRGITERSFMRHGWERGQWFVGRTKNGVGFHKWKSGNKLHYRAWGTDAEAVRKRFYDFHNQQPENISDFVR